MASNQIIVTGTKEDAQAFATRLQAMGFDASALETIRITKKKLSAASVAALQAIGSYDYLLLTSPHAAQIFGETLRDLWIKKPRAIRVAAVGSATAQALRLIGFAPHIIPKEYGATELVNMLKDIDGKKILFPRSANASEDAITALRAGGATVTAIILYAASLIKADTRIFEEAISGADRIIFLSPSGIAGFAKNYAGNILSGHVLEMHALCIGPTTAQAASQAGFRHITIAKPSTLGGIIKALSITS
jgi:uroporphyrinogen-III synthase